MGVSFPTADMAESRIPHHVPPSGSLATANDAERQRKVVTLTPLKKEYRLARRELRIDLVIGTVPRLRAALQYKLPGRAPCAAPAARVLGKINPPCLHRLTG